MALTIAAALVAALIFMAGTFATEAVTPIVDFVITLAVEPLSIPIVNQAILWGQLCATVIVVIIRIAKGIYSGVLARGGDRPDSFGEWAMKTVLSIAGVSLMPVFCNMVITLGSLMFADVQSVGETFALGGAPLDEDYFDSISSMPLESLGKTFAAGVLVVFVIGACVKVAYELLKREMILLIVSVVAPWVSIKGAMDSADDYLDLLVSLLGLCLTQWIQYIFLIVAVSMFNDFAHGLSWVEIDFFTGNALLQTMTVFAALGAALAVPEVIERYSFSTGRGGTGAMVVGMLVRNGVSGGGRAISALSSKIASTVKG